MFEVHEFILKRSTYFMALWNSHKAGNEPQSPIEINDILARDFNGILQYLYTDDAGFITEENIFGVYTAGLF